MGPAFGIHFSLLMPEEFLYFPLIYTKIIRKNYPESSLLTLMHGSFKHSQGYFLYIFMHAEAQCDKHRANVCVYKHKYVCTDTHKYTYIKYISEFSTKFCLEESAHAKRLCAHTDSAIKIQLKFY